MRTVKTNQVWRHRQTGDLFTVVELPKPSQAILRSARTKGERDEIWELTSIEDAFEWQKDEDSPSPPPIYAGAVVRLKSGGPQMTVLHGLNGVVHGNNGLDFNWWKCAYVPEYGSSGVVIKDDFPTEALMLVPQEQQNASQTENVDRGPARPERDYGVTLTKLG